MAVDVKSVPLDPHTQSLVFRLPDEVLSHVFVMGHEMHDGPVPYGAVVSGVLRHVCNVARSTATLWSDLSWTSYGDEENVTLLETFLERSRLVSLTILMEILRPQTHSPPVSTAVEVLAKHLHHCRTLAFSSHNACEWVALALSPTNRLEYLDLLPQVGPFKQVDRGYTHTLIGFALNLRHLTSDNHLIPWDYPIPSSLISLTILNISALLSNWSTFVQGTSYTIYVNNLTISTDGLGPKGSDLLYLPELTRLTICGERTDLLPLLLAFSAPAITHITVQRSWLGLQDPLSIRLHFPSATHLDLCGLDGVVIPDYWATISREIPSMTHLFVNTLDWVAYTYLIRKVQLFPRLKHIGVVSMTGRSACYLVAAILDTPRTSNLREPHAFDFHDCSDYQMRQLERSQVTIV